MGSGNASTSATGSPTCWPRPAREHPASTRPREIAPIFGLCPTLTGHALRTGSCFLRCRRNPLRVPSACLFPRPAPAHTRPVLTSLLRAGSAADCARPSADLARAPRPQGGQGWSVRSRVASRVYRSTGSAVRCVSPWWDARSFDADRSRQRSNRAATGPARSGGAASCSGSGPRRPNDLQLPGGNIRCPGIRIT